ncbi:branched-chain amino acid ABC transporter permease [soil metagenome]
MSGLVLQTMVDSTSIALLYALVGLSFGVIYVATGVMHIAHGATYLIAGYALFTAYSSMRLPLWIAIASAAVVAVATGLGWAFALYEPLRKRGSSAQVVLVASLGAFAVVQNLLLMAFGSDTQVVSQAAVAQGLSWGPVFVTPLQLVSASTCALLIAVVIYVVKASTLGRNIRALADDPELALILGVKVRSTRAIVFALGSFLVAICAVLGTLDVGLSPLSGLRVVLIAAVATILGGTRSIYGGVLGGLVVGVLETAGSMVLEPRWQNVIVFCAMLLGLVLRPRGLLGK